MRRYYTENELNALLKKMTVVIDTREQRNEHILDWLESRELAYLKRKLAVGDYSAMLEGQTLESDVAIERKGSIDEIAGNFTAERDRFEREMLRGKANRTQLFLLIENCSWQDIMAHNYRSKMQPKALLASLLSWQARFNLNVIFCGKDEAGTIIYSILYYSLREQLLRGGRAQWII